LLDLTLAAYGQTEELAAVAESRLDTIGKANVRVQRLAPVPGLGVDVVTGKDFSIKPTTEVKAVTENKSTKKALKRKLWHASQ
jgi:hypothetical protein